MAPSPSEVFLIFLELGDDPLTSYAIARALGQDPADPERAVRDVVARMIHEEILLEFDVENDALDGVVVEHAQYGTLENDDLSYMHVDDFYGLGPKSLEFVDRHKSELMELAADRGLVNALGNLRALRIDSASWTGLPTGFSFTTQVQAKVVKLIERAISEIAGSNLGNDAKAQTSAYLRAALLLAEAPDPPPDMIAELIRRLRYFGEAVGFLSAVVGLFSTFGIKP